jgi:hypothetical protein
VNEKANILYWTVAGFPWISSAFNFFMYPDLIY